MTRFWGDGLACVRGGRTVFAGLGFALGAGAALLVTGPNGSGKSSLLRLMAGLIAPAQGRLGWDDHIIADDAEAHAARLHYVGHLDAVKPALTVAENLAFWAGLRGAGTGEVAGALQWFGLGALAGLPARFLSAGQRRRLALARLRAAPAALWLLDEPSVGLDAPALAALDAAIAHQRQGGGSVVVATNVALAIPGAVTLDVAAFVPAGVAAA